MGFEPAPRDPTVAMGFAVAGSEIVGFAVVGILVDYALGNFNHFPWATVVLAPLGTVVAFWHLARFVRTQGKL